MTYFPQTSKLSLHYYVHSLDIIYIVLTGYTSPVPQVPHIYNGVL